MFIFFYSRPWMVLALASSLSAAVYETPAIQPLVANALPFTSQIKRS